MPAIGRGPSVRGAHVPLESAVGVRVFMSVLDCCITLDKLVSRLSVLRAMYQSSCKSELDMYVSYNSRNCLPEEPGAPGQLLD